MRYKQTGVLLRAIRNKVFEYPEHKDNQVSKVIEYLRSRKLKDRNESVGHYSGLTNRELRMCGRCETDFY